MNMKKNSRGLPFLWKVVLVLLPIVVSILALVIGRMPITLADLYRSVISHLFGGEGIAPLADATLWRFRMPRILLALLAGAGLSVAGCAFQSLFSNPLATPDTLGVASGASFGAALGLLWGFSLVGVQISAMLSGVLAMALTVLTGMGKRHRSLSGVVLAGIMIGSLFTALISFVKFSADVEDELPAITYFLMGDLGSASYKNLLFGAPPILFGILVLYLLRWRLNLLPLGEEEAMSIGVNFRLLRAVTVFSATMVTASVISMCGQVGWVGLLVPHMCRMKFGNNHIKLIPSSALLGAAFMVAADTAARSISAAELPVSILTAFVGAPFFIYLMRKSRGWQL